MAAEDLGATEGQVGLTVGASFSEKIPVLRIALFALLALPCVAPASAETLTGGARIIDADTVEIAGEKLRLEGIDAPESRQTCKRDGKRHSLLPILAHLTAQALEIVEHRPADLSQPGDGWR